MTSLSVYLCGALVPRHPLRRAGRQFLSVALQLGQIVEGVGAAQLTSVNQAHEQVAHLRPVQRPIEQGILPVKNRPLQRPFDEGMPRSGLCRVTTN